MRLLIVDDHPVVVSGCRAIFGSRGDIEIVDVPDGERGVDAYFEVGAEVALIDINLPGISGIEVIRRIIAREPNARLIAFSMNEDPSIASRAIEMGASAYLTKTDKPEQFREAVDKVTAGDIYLTPTMAPQIAFLRARAGEKGPKLSEREEVILRLLGSGKSMADIAALLDVSYKTIANNCTALKNKLGARGTQDLMRIAVEKRKP
jgi:DNA-binding NarL/FixJ family response regulator